LGGDALVVYTTNFGDKTRFRNSSENLHVVERFSRIDATTLRYQFTSRGSCDVGAHVVGRGRRGRRPTRWMYRYACHEGNYALGDILRGSAAEGKALIPTL